MPAVTADPLSLRKAVQYFLPQSPEDWGLGQAWCGGDLLDELCVVAAVLDHSRRVQQFVYEGVAEQHLVTGEYGVEADCDSARRDP